jgi:hypothetical protein
MDPLSARPSLSHSNDHSNLLGNIQNGNVSNILLFHVQKLNVSGFNIELLTTECVFNAEMSTAGVTGSRG